MPWYRAGLLFYLTETYGIHAEGYAIDLRNNDEIEAMMDFANRAFGSIDILVCNAGITIHNWATDYPIEDIDKVFDLDIRGYYLCARTAARYMKKQGKGSIVMISSANSVIYHSKRSLYNVSKSATAGMAGTLGVELARFGIRVNSVGPGYVATDLVKQGVENGTIKIIFEKGNNESAHTAQTVSDVCNSTTHRNLLNRVRYQILIITSSIRTLFLNERINSW